jgi:1-acyl-sn-glycerol-3-phosphate acyltransferase
MIRLIITVLFLLLFFLCSLLLFLFEWILEKYNKRAADISSLRIVQWALRVVLLCAGTKVTVIGEENVPKDAPVLYAANHTGFFDVVATYSRCPGLTGFVAKKSILKVPILRTWMKRLYCIFLDRENNREALKSILLGIEQLKAGISIFIFPEGTRNSTDTTIAKFKEGSFKMAEKAGCPVIPVAINNSGAVLENNNYRIRRAHIIIEYCEPIDVSKLDKEEKKRLGATVQKIIQEKVNKNAALV